SAGRVVYAARQGVFVHDLQTGEDRMVASLPDDVELAIPSPDGRWVGYATGAGTVSVASLVEDRSFEVAARFSIPVGWTPDNRLVVGELVGDRDLVAVKPDGGREVLLTGGYANGAYPVWIDDDTFAIAASEESFVIAEGGKVVTRDEGVPLAVSPDGAQLLVVRDDTLVTLDMENDLEPLDELYDGKVSYAVANAQGLLAIATEKDVRVFEAGTRTRTVVKRPVDHIAWGHAGTVLLYAHDGAGYAIEVPDGKPKRITRIDADLFGLLSFQVVS
ncbi:MAG: hypothetical protein WD826_10740, partial [Actinomycetota bacterium]